MLVLAMGLLSVVLELVNDSGALHLSDKRHLTKVRSVQQQAGVTATAAQQRPYHRAPDMVRFARGRGAG